MKNRLSIGAVALAFAASVACYPWLPDQVPIHFDIRGHADGFASRPVGAFLLPAVMLGFVLLCYASWRATKHFQAVSSILACFFLSLHVLMLRAALGSGDIGSVMWVVIGVMFVALGLALPRVRRNRWVGVRTPWSMSSDEAWARTHRAAGRVMVACGAAVALVPNVAVRAVALAVLVIVPIAQSWWIARRLGAS